MPTRRTWCDQGVHAQAGSSARRCLGDRSDHLVQVAEPRGSRGLVLPGRNPVARHRRLSDVPQDAESPSHGAPSGLALLRRDEDQARSPWSSSPEQIPVRAGDSEPGAPPCLPARATPPTPPSPSPITTPSQRGRILADHHPRWSPAPRWRPPSRPLRRPPHVRPRGPARGRVRGATEAVSIFHNVPV